MHQIFSPRGHSKHFRGQNRDSYQIFMCLKYFCTSTVHYILWVIKNDNQEEFEEGSNGIDTKINDYILVNL